LPARVAKPRRAARDSLVQTGRSQKEAAVHSSPLVLEFLAQPRLAVVGVSRDPRDFSRLLLAELLRRGYDAVPVNPLLPEVDGRRCYGRVSDVVPAPENALILTPPSAAEDVVRDCARAGVRRLWLHRGAGRGAVTPAALALCREHGIAVVPGACAFMHLPGTGLVHRVHGFVARWLE
jgi:predicted CoA-binding protein